MGAPPDSWAGAGWWIEPHTGQGFSLLQGLSQHPRLLIQEGAVFQAVDLFRLLRQSSGLLIGLLGLLDLLPGPAAVLQHPNQVFQGLLLLPGPLLTVQQLGFLLGQPLGGLENLPVGLKLFCVRQQLFGKLVLLLTEFFPLALGPGNVHKAGLPRLHLGLQGVHGSSAPLPAVLLPQQPLLAGLRVGQLGQFALPALQLQGLFLAGAASRLPVLLQTDNPLSQVKAQLFLLCRLPVAGHLRLQGGQFPAQLLLVRDGFLRGLEGLLGQLHPGQQRRPALAGLLQLFLGLLALLRLAQQGSRVLALLVQPVQNLLLAALLLPVPGQKTFNQLHRVLEGQLPRLGLFQLIPEQVVFPAGHSGDVLPDTGPGPVALPLEFSRLVFHPLLEHHVVPGLKNLPKNLLAALSVRQQQF